MDAGVRDDLNQVEFPCIISFKNNSMIMLARKINTITDKHVKTG